MSLYIERGFAYYKFIGLFVNLYTYVGVLKLILTPPDDCLLDSFYFKTQTAFYNISKQVSVIEVKTEQHDPEQHDPEKQY